MKIPRTFCTRKEFMPWKLMASPNKTGKIYEIINTNSKKKNILTRILIIKWFDKLLEALISADGIPKSDKLWRYYCCWRACLLFMSFNWSRCGAYPHWDSVLHFDVWIYLKYFKYLVHSKICLFFFSLNVLKWWQCNINVSFICP